MTRLRRKYKSGESDGDAATVCGSCVEDIVNTSKLSR